MTPFARILTPRIHAAAWTGIADALMRRWSDRPGRVRDLLALIITLSAVDLWLTISHMAGGGMLEDNPLAVILVRLTGSFTPLVALKTFSVALAVASLHRIRHHLRGELAACASAVGLVVLTIHWVRYEAFMATLDSDVLRVLADHAHWVNAC